MEIEWWRRWCLSVCLASKLYDTGVDIDSFASEAAITTLVDSRLEYLVAGVDKHYGGSIIPTLFKNLKKCEHLYGEVKSAIAAAKD